LIVLQRGFAGGYLLLVIENRSPYLFQPFYLFFKLTFIFFDFVLFCLIRLKLGFFQHFLLWATAQ